MSAMGRERPERGSKMKPTVSGPTSWFSDVSLLVVRSRGMSGT